MQLVTFLFYCLCLLCLLFSVLLIGIVNVTYSGTHSFIHFNMWRKKYIYLNCMKKHDSCLEHFTYTSKHSLYIVSMNCLFSTMFMYFITCI